MPIFRSGEHLSWRVTGVEEAAILRVSRKVRELRARGADIAALNIGEPDFDTPENIRAAACAAIGEGWTHYPPVGGVRALQEAIAKKLKQENGIDCAPEEIVVTNGAKQAIFNAVFSLVEEGDEVVLLSPYWSAYEGAVRLAGGRPVILPSSFEAGYKVSASQIASAMSARTKLVILNSPSNPSGVVMSETDLRALANVIRAHPSAMILSDEIYEYIVFGGARPRSIAALPGMKPRTITVNGFSKGFAMTGWRIGYAAAPEPLARAMTRMQGAVTSGVNAMTQRAAIAALSGPREAVEAMRGAYEARRKLTLTWLSSMPGVRTLPPQGAFYAFPDIAPALNMARARGLARDVAGFCDWLLERHGVACIPGSAFGVDTAIRISFAASTGELEKGLERLSRGMNDLLG